VPVIDVVKENTNDSIIIEESHLPIEAWDSARPNSTTLFGGLEVRVGDLLVTEENATPVDVEARFERMPDTSTEEALVSSYVTTLFRSHDRPLKRHATGELYIKQTTTDQDFDVRALYFPRTTEARVWKMLEAHVATLTKRLGNDSLIVHFVNAASVHDDMPVEDRFLPILGWYACLAGDEQFATLPGLRMKKGDRTPTLHIPELLYGSKFGMWYAALTQSDADTMDVLVRSLARSVPGAVLGPRGWASGESWVVATIKARFRETLAQADESLLARHDQLMGRR
jgi:hypothetical protein